MLFIFKYYFFIKGKKSAFVKHGSRFVTFIHEDLYKITRNRTHNKKIHMNFFSFKLFSDEVDEGLLHFMLGQFYCRLQRFHFQGWSTHTINAKRGFKYVLHSIQGLRQHFRQIGEKFGSFSWRFWIWMYNISKESAIYCMYTLFFFFLFFRGRKYKNKNKFS